MVTVLAFGVLFLLIPVNRFFLKQPPDRMVRRLVRVYGLVLVRYVPFMAPVTMEDRSGWRKRPVIFVANHASAVDPYLFGTVPEDTSFVTTWPFRIPFYRNVMEAAGYVQAERGWDHVLERGKELLEKGCSLIIWPEGHRSRDGRLGRFTNGAFILSFMTGIPVLPVCITGSDRLMPPGSRFFTPARVGVTLLPPVFPAGKGYDPAGIVDMRERTRRVIADEMVARGVDPERVRPVGRRETANA